MIWSVCITRVFYDLESSSSSVMTLHLRLVFVYFLLPLPAPVFAQLVLQWGRSEASPLSAWVGLSSGGHHLSPLPPPFLLRSEPIVQEKCIVSASSPPLSGV